MSELERMQKYIERTRLPARATSPYNMTIREMTVLEEIVREKELFRGLLFAFKYGMAKGWRAAMKESRA